MRLRCRVLLCFVLVLMTLALFRRVSGYDFIAYDDEYYVTANPNVLHGVTLPSVVWAFTKYHSSNWHPLTWISHMLDVTLFGMNPGGHHVTGLVFHVLNVVLLFVALVRLTGSNWRSLFVAALFAVHPLHVEPVASIAGRKDVLSAFFLLLTILAYHRYVRRPGVKRYLLSLLLFAMGLASKPMLVTLPVLLLLLDYWPLGRFSGGQGNSGAARRLVLEKIPFFALALASCAVTIIVQVKSGAVGSLDEYPAGVRISNAIFSYAGYIAKMLFPRRLAVFYPHPGNTLPVWEVAVLGLVLAAATVIFLRASRRPYLAAGWLWYLISLLPVIGLVQVGHQAMADRYTYLPLVGLFIVIAWGVPDLFAEARKLHRLAIPSILSVAGLMAVSWLQVGYWKDSITLFGHALECTERNYVAHNNLGTALARQGKMAEAIGHFEEALRYRPDMSEARDNLAKARKLARRE